MQWKLIRDGQVVNVIAAEQPFIDAIRGQYDDVLAIAEGEVVEGWGAQAPDEGRVLSVLGFRSRFTQAEKVAIYTAAKTEVGIQIWLDDLNAVKDNEVHLDDERTVVGVQALEAAGLIGAGRAAEILA